MDKAEARRKFRLARNLYEENRYAEALVILHQLREAFPKQQNILKLELRCVAAVELVPQNGEVDIQAEPLLPAGTGAPPLPVRLEDPAPTTQPTPSTSQAPPHRAGRSLLVYAIVALLTLLALATVWGVLNHLAASRQPAPAEPVETGEAVSEESPEPKPAPAVASPDTQPAGPLAHGLKQVLEVPLAYETDVEPLPSMLDLPVSRMVPMSVEPPEDTWWVPSLIAAEPVNAVFELGDHVYLAILDATNGENYDRLYFDANGNGDLEDDAPLDGVIREIRAARTRRLVFPSVDLTLEVDGNEVPYSFVPVATGPYGAPRQGDPTDLHIIPNCTYTGEFTIGARTFAIAFDDTNANGRFGEHYSLEWDDPGDFVGLWDVDGTASPEGQPFGSTLVIDEDTLDVQLDIPGERVLLSPIPGAELCPVDLAQPVSSFLWLYDAANDDCAVLRNTPAAVRLPEGDYAVMAYELQQDADEVGTWYVRALAVDSPYVTVRRERRPSLAFAGPFLAVAGITPPLPLDPSVDPVHLGFILVGAANEHVAAFGLRDEKGDIALEYTCAAGRWQGVCNQPALLPQPPTYTIEDAGGNVVVSGAFRYEEGNTILTAEWRGSSPNEEYYVTCDFITPFLDTEQRAVPLEVFE